MGCLVALDGYILTETENHDIFTLIHIKRRAVRKSGNVKSWRFFNFMVVRIKPRYLRSLSLTVNLVFCIVFVRIHLFIAIDTFLLVGSNWSLLMQTKNHTSIEASISYGTATFVHLRQEPSITDQNRDTPAFSW